MVEGNLVNEKLYLLIIQNVFFCNNSKNAPCTCLVLLGNANGLFS